MPGLHDRPTLVDLPTEWRCLELRLTPLAARAIFAVPMDSLRNATVEIEDVLGPRGRLLTERLRAAPTWAQRFELLDGFLAARVEQAPPPSADVVRGWHRLLETGGRVEIGALAGELRCSGVTSSRSSAGRSGSRRRPWRGSSASTGP